MKAHFARVGVEPRKSPLSEWLLGRINRYWFTKLKQHILKTKEWWIP